MAAERSTFSSLSSLSERSQTAVAVLAAATIFILALWIYSATQASLACHSKQGHIKLGMSPNLIVCSFHDGVPRG